MNSDWSDFVSVRPHTSYFRTGLSLYRSHVKRKQISDWVHKYGSIIFAFLVK